jgi:hypothetical protein
LKHLERLLTIDDMRAAARRTLPKMLFDFVNGGGIVTFGSNSGGTGLARA